MIEDRFEAIAFVNGHQLLLEQLKTLQLFLVIFVALLVGLVLGKLLLDLFDFSPYAQKFARNDRLPGLLELTIRHEFFLRDLVELSLDLLKRDVVTENRISANLGDSPVVSMLLELACTLWSLGFFVLALTNPVYFGIFDSHSTRNLHSIELVHLLLSLNLCHLLLLLRPLVCRVSLGWKPCWP